MRRILPLLLATTIALPACTVSSGTKRTGIVAGLVTAAAGAAVAGYATSLPCETKGNLGDGVGCIVEGTGLFTAGLVLAAVGLVVLGASATANVQESPPVPRASEAPAFAGTVEQLPASQMVKQLTETARTAARQGSCRAVETIAERIAELDPTFRRGGFVLDADIAGCVD